MSFSLVTFTSCSSDDDGGSGGNAPAGTIVAKIGGSNFKSLAMASAANYVAAGNMLSIQGNNADGDAIVMVINGYEGVGTYEIGSGVGGIAVTASYTKINIDLGNPANSTSQVWQAPYTGSGIAGTINVSSDADGKIKGTFEFEAKSTTDDSFKNVTNGAFNLDKTTH